MLLHWHGSALSVQAVILQSVSGAAASGDRNALTKMNCFMLDLKWQFLPSDDLVWSGVVRGVPVGSTIGIAWLVESNWRPDCRAPQTPPLHESQVRVCSPHVPHWPGGRWRRLYSAISTMLFRFGITSTSLFRARSLESRRRFQLAPARHRPSHSKACDSHRCTKFPAPRLRIRPSAMNCTHS